MKIFLTTAIILLLNMPAGIAGNNTISPEQKAQAGQWMQSQPVKFLENKGQVVDMIGNPAPFVLFKAETPGMSMYITEKGITYLFVKPEEKEKHKKEIDSKQLAIDNQKNKNDENIQVKWERIDMELQGAGIRKENITKETASVTDFNFFLSHCPQGIYGVKEYEKITIKEVYPGIDWMLYNSSDKGFKYDFVVHPNADIKQIKLIYSSLNPLTLNKDGSMDIKTTTGTLSEQTPYSYIKDTQEEMAVNFQITDQQYINNQYYQTTVSFSLNSMSDIRNTTWVIDPQLVWATFYGGSALDGPQSIDCDVFGNVFITGYTTSTDFPVLNPGGTYFQGVNGQGVTWGDAFIFKFSNTGVRLWATYYGGSGNERGLSICADSSGNVFVTGMTRSGNFPVFNPLGGAYFQGVYGGGTSSGGAQSGGDAFILKFDDGGVRKWATYYGGNGNDQGNSVCTDIFGNIFITGYTASTDFPIQNPGGLTYFQGVFAGGGWPGDAFILKFNNTGIQLWATYYGGSGVDMGNSICSDPSGNIFITGYTNSTDFPVLNPGGGAYFQGSYIGSYDAFILKFSNVGMQIWATLYAGGGWDYGYSICSDLSGNIFVIGYTATVNLPLLNPGNGTYFQGYGGSEDVFILKFDNAGVRLWATYYGKNGDEIFNSYDNVAIDPCGNIYISFETESNNIPVLPSCNGGFCDSSFNGGPFDIFIVKFSNAGVRLWATYFGGNGYEFRAPLATDDYGNLFIAGEWSDAMSVAFTSASYPLTNPGGGAYYDGIFNGGDDGYVAKFIPPALILTDTTSPAGCGCMGTASVTPLGGCSPYYLYAWYDSSWIQIGSDSNISNLCAGNYQVIVKDTINCSIDTAFVTITGTGSLTLSSIQNNVLCKGDSTGSATITASGGTGALTYSWFPGGQTSTTATGLIAGTYSITITDSIGCSTTKTVTITEPTALTAVSTATAACGMNNGGATAIAIGGTVPYTYSWSPSGGNNSTASGLTSGAYTCVITDGNGCTNTSTVIVTANSNPTAVAWSNITITQGQIATLSASGGGAYSWNNGSKDSSITVGPLVTTVYCVTVTDTNNCTDTACVTVTIELIDCSIAGELYLPNAFSPNDDGENDVLQIYYGDIACIKFFNLVIYNRWGEKVFNTNDPSAQWTGSFRGKIESTAVFVYYIKATLISGEEISAKGNVSLIK